MCWERAQNIITIDSTMTRSAFVGDGRKFEVSLGDPAKRVEIGRKFGALDGGSEKNTVSKDLRLSDMTGFL